MWCKVFTPSVLVSADLGLLGSEIDPVGMPELQLSMYYQMKGKYVSGVWWDGCFSKQLEGISARHSVWDDVIQPLLQLPDLNVDDLNKILAALTASRDKEVSDMLEQSEQQLQQLKHSVDQWWERQEHRTQNEGIVFKWVDSQLIAAIKKGYWVSQPSFRRMVLSCCACKTCVNTPAWQYAI